MTGNEIFNTALSLLGYTDSNGEVSGAQRFMSRAITVINSIYGDLFYTQKSSGFKPITSLDQEIELSERILANIMPYGVAAFLAQSESDGDNQQLFISLYNKKRASLTHTEKRIDTMPYPY